jgi:hypothetical protein
VSGLIALVSLSDSRAIRSFDPPDIAGAESGPVCMRKSIACENLFDVISNPIGTVFAKSDS